MHACRSNTFKLHVVVPPIMVGALQQAARWASQRAARSVGFVLRCSRS